MSSKQTSVDPQDLLTSQSNCCCLKISNDQKQSEGE